VCTAVCVFKPAKAAEAQQMLPGMLCISPPSSVSPAHGYIKMFILLIFRVGK